MKFADCEHCGQTILEFTDGRWKHIAVSGFFGSVGCRAASFKSGQGWDETLNRSWKAKPKGGTGRDSPRAIRGEDQAMKGETVKITCGGCGKSFSTPEELAAWKRRDEARAAEREAFEAFMAVMRATPYDDEAAARASATHHERIEATERAYLEAHGPRCT